MIPQKMVKTNMTDENFYHSAHSVVQTKQYYLLPHLTQFENKSSALPVEGERIQISIHTTPIMYYNTSAKNVPITT